MPVRRSTRHNKAIGDSAGPYRQSTANADTTNGDSAGGTGGANDIDDDDSGFRDGGNEDDNTIEVDLDTYEIQTKYNITASSDLRDEWFGRGQFENKPVPGGVQAAYSRMQKGPNKHTAYLMKRNVEVMEKMKKKHDRNKSNPDETDYESVFREIDEKFIGNNTEGVSMEVLYKKLNPPKKKR